MQAVLVVLLSQGVTATLLRNHVHEHGAAEFPRAAERMLERLLVMAVDRAQVLQPEVFEHNLRLQDVLQALLDPVQGVEQRRPDQRSVRERGLDQVKHLLVALRHPDRGEVIGESADGALVGPAVVVDHDDDRAVLGASDVIQRFPGHAAGQRPVADHGDYPAVLLAAQVQRLGQTVRVRQASRGVRVLDPVVLGLGPARVAGDATLLPEPGEALHPASQQLVHVRLVAGVPDDRIGRGVEHTVQGDGQLDDAEIRAQVAAVARHGLDQELPDFAGEYGQFVRGQRLDISRTPDRLEQPHLVRSSRREPNESISRMLGSLHAL